MRDPCAYTHAHASLRLFLTKMRASSFCYPMIFQGLHAYCPRRPPCQRLELHRYGSVQANIRAIHKDEDLGGAMEDNRSIPRMHNRKAKAINVGADKPSPSPERMEWNEQYCRKFFESDSCEVLGLLEIETLDERPTLAVGLTVMVTLSIPASVLVVMLHFMDAAREVLHLLHLDDD